MTSSHAPPSETRNCSLSNGRRARRPSWRSWRLGPALLLAGLVPTLAAGWQAAGLSDSRAGDRWDNIRNPRAKVLAQIPDDPAVLINVTGREMPASPDILNLGKRSTRALERCLSDNVDASLRSTCAVVLQALGDRRALGTLHTALEDWDANVRHQVIRALGAMPDASSIDPLLRLYQRKDEELYNRAAILESLGAMSNRRVVQVLRKELRRGPDENDGEDLRPVAFRALWASRHLMARPTLVGDVRAALQSDNDGLVLTATEASAELRAPQLVGALIPLMEHKWAEVRNKAVYALGRIGDRTATKALLERLPKVRESRMLNNIAFALERLDKKAFYQSIQGVIEHKQAIIRLNAAFVLGDVRHPEGWPMLQKALGDPSDYVKTSAVVAVGKLGAKQPLAEKAIAALEDFAEHPNLSIRQEAIYAIDALSPQGRNDLIYDRLFVELRRDPKLRRRHQAVIRRAAVALGQAGDGRVRDYLVACLESYGCSQGDVAPLLTKQPGPQASGRVLLAWARGREDLTGLVAELKPAGALPVASSALEAAWARRQNAALRHSIDLLGNLGDASVQSLLRPRSTSKNTWLRLHARVAMARLGDEPSAARLTAEMDNLPAEWLPRFARLVAHVAEPSVRARIEPELVRRQTDPDVRIALAAAAIRLAWNPDDAIFRFLDALGSPLGYERDLAEYYLMRRPEERVTWLLRRALARETRDSTRDRLRALLDRRG